MQAQVSANSRTDVSRLKVKNRLQLTCKERRKRLSVS